MSKDRMVNIWSVRPPRRPDYEAILTRASEILEARSFTGAVDVDSWTADDILSYWALRYIGASRIPVANGTYTLEDLGFYDLSDYPSLAVANEPFQAVLAGKPTPVVRLPLYGDGPSIWAKLEWYNPFSLSVKDRIAWYMIRDAMESGIIGEGRGLVEVSSSNTGIAIAALARSLGLRVRIYLPSKAPVENARILKLLGAEVVYSDKPITTEVIDEVKEEAAKSGLINLDQFNNDANLEMHMRYTAREYYLQLDRAGVRPTVLVLASGTSGTASAIIFLFNKLYGRLRNYVVVPSQGSFIEGIRRIETGVKWLHGVGIEYSVIDVSREEALRGMKTMASKTGLIPGVSGGAVIAAIGKMYEEGLISSGDVVATLIPDSGFKYPKAVAEALGEA